MDKKCRVALIGCGVVGKEVLRNLRTAHREDENWPRIEGAENVEFKCIGVADWKSFSCGEELDPGELLNQKKNEEYFENFVVGGDGGLALLEKLKDLELQPDILIEVSPSTDDGEPACSYIENGMKLGSHAVMSNKGPIVANFEKLQELVRVHSKSIRCEATVGGEIPFLDLITSNYRDKPVIIRGVLNGTTNFILTKLGQGMSYETAFAKAKELGLTETDPGEDLLGIDHARKLVILSKLAGKPLREEDVLVRGMVKQFGNDFGEISFDELIKERKVASESGYSLIDELEKSKNGLVPKMIAELDLGKGRGVVKLEWVGEDGLLAKVENELNAVMIKDQEGNVLWKSEAMRGAGGEATANAILRDCVKIANSENPLEESMIR